MAALQSARCTRDYLIELYSPVLSAHNTPQTGGTRLVFYLTLQGFARSLWVKCGSGDEIGEPKQSLLAVLRNVHPSVPVRDT